LDRAAKFSKSLLLRGNKKCEPDVKLTTKGRYAVQAMADIAAHAGHEGRDGALVSLPDVAIRQGISAGYLEQLFAKLRRAGLVDSVRGVSGGYRLARAASKIRISEIVDAVDEEIHTTACNGSPVGCQGSGARCLTHDLWEELGRQIELFLAAASLEDVIEKRIVGMAAVNAPSFETPHSPHPEERRSRVAKDEANGTPQDEGEGLKLGAAE
jgi:Rrf2 family iron-sulfur cluster assembly transcriptional regulator